MWGQLPPPPPGIFVTFLFQNNEHPWCVAFLGASRSNLSAKVLGLRTAEVEEKRCGITALMARLLDQLSATLRSEFESNKECLFAASQELPAA